MKKKDITHKLNPQVSVITVVFNAADLIEMTLNSVFEQTYSNIEYIVIDGGSTDGTCDIISQYCDRLGYYLSESDKGIYDAMNKGIRASHGQWISFMNAGDMFYSPQSLESIMENAPFEEKIKVVYGDVALKFNDQPYIIKRLENVNEDIVQFSLNHQSTLIEGEWLRQTMYDTRYRICADANFFNETAKAGYKFQYVPVIISKYESSEGVSSVNQMRMFREYVQIRGTRKWSLEWWRAYSKALFYSSLHHFPFGMGDRLLFEYVKRRV